ncbi:MAG TPA: helix-turn-helix transcriptional regulator [Acidobacteriota bacterium]|nr:helix-turn-helix transcriptional regulator [Acidobacteriota bacterium]
MRVTAEKRRPESVLPLKPVDYLVLLVLAGQDRHGYGIVQDIEERSQGQIRLEPGNLYRTIRRLMGQGLLKETERRPAPESDDERRRYYCLTPFGLRVAEAETARLKRLVRFAESHSLAEGKERA